MRVNIFKKPKNLIEIKQLDRNLNGGKDLCSGKISFVHQNFV